MSGQVDLLGAHCVFMRDVEIAWLKLWSELYPQCGTPNAESVGKYVAAFDVAVAKYREACYAAVGSD